jgi:hypothetical protein
MIRIYPGDLIAVEAEQKVFYALILDRILYIGGNWCYAFHRVTDGLLGPEEVLEGFGDGFHAFVDFIWAKRENRITRLAKKLDCQRYRGAGFLKSTLGKLSTCPRWYIYVMRNRELKSELRLTKEEKRYPVRETINDLLMIERVSAGWRPEIDEDIKVVANYAAKVARQERRRRTKRCT